VEIEGLLVNRHQEQGEQVLEMQYGLRTALARLRASDVSWAAPAIGSKLRLTGVYLGLGGNRALDRSSASFELLLNSGADILLLARPPWWTLPRALGAFGVVAVILLGTMLWVFSLRRQVRAQTEIIRRTALRQATLEERTRIAQDIHDELGSSLTRIMLLGERAQEDVGRPAELGVHARKIVTSARSAVQVLDEIVWAVNPENDTLEGLAGYLNQYANQFFESTSIRCRLEIPAKLPTLLLPADVRHDLFLVVKEALHNVLKHSQASQVRVRLTAIDSTVEITVTDNGCGFNAAGAGEGRKGNGLGNMRQRMEALGGAFHLESATGQGTSLRFTVMVNGESERGS
jgi:signal transduction histidine kinase